MGSLLALSLCAACASRKPIIDPAGRLMSADNETAKVIKNCMRNRGYAVLN